MIIVALAGKAPHHPRAVAMPALAPRPSSSATRKLSGDSSSGSEATLNLQSAAQNKRGNLQRINTESQTQKVAGQNGRARDRSWEKPPSKDGAAQRAAGEVAGLKDYVGHVFHTRLALGTVAWIWQWRIRSRQEELEREPWTRE